MNIKFSNKGIILFLMLLLLVSGLAFSSSVESDPLITLSYLEQRLEEFINEFNSSPKASSQYVALEISANTQIKLGASSEIIVRGGSAFVISPYSYGLPDITSGIDVLNNQQIMLNHLLISPKDDGRGILFRSPGVIMIKGEYIIFNE
jgi:hypothetical protein